MGLPWIPINTDVAEHGKTLALAARLGIEPAAALGYLVRLWTWAARVQEDGTVRGLSADTIIESGAGWRGEPGKFVAAAAEERWLDRVEGGFYLHDWHDHAGRQVLKAKEERERKQKSRARPSVSLSAECPRTVRGTSAERPAIVRGEMEREIEREKKEETKTLAADAAPVPASLPKPKKPTNPRVGEVIALWCRLWADAHPGSAYRVTGKDAGQAKSLASWPEATDAEIERRFRRAMLDPWFAPKADLPLFVSQWNKHGGGSATAPKPSASRYHPDLYKRQAVEALVDLKRTDPEKYRAECCDEDGGERDLEDAMSTLTDKTWKPEGVANA